MTAAADDAAGAAAGIAVLVADVQRQVTALETAVAAAAALSAAHGESGSDEYDASSGEEEGVERISDYFMERASRKQVHGLDTLCQAGARPPLSVGSVWS